MIKAISATHVRQECGACGALRDVPASQLLIGFASPGHFAFPPCVTCGAQEFARREGSNSNPAEFDSEHNGAVNFAHRLALESGVIDAKASPALRDLLKAEKDAGRWPHIPKRLVEPTGAAFEPVRSVEEEYAQKN